MASTLQNLPSLKKSKEIRRKLKKKSIRPETKNFIKAIGAFLGGCCRFPYLLSKAIKLIEEKNQRPPPVPSKIQFARALYEFNPQNPQVEAPLEPKEIVAILDSRDNWLRIRKEAEQWDGFL